MNYTKNCSNYSVQILSKILHLYKTIMIGNITETSLFYLERGFIFVKTAQHCFVSRNGYQVLTFSLWKASYKSCFRFIVQRNCVVLFWHLPLMSLTIMENMLKYKLIRFKSHTHPSTGEFPALSDWLQVFSSLNFIGSQVYLRRL